MKKEDEEGKYRNPQIVRDRKRKKKPRGLSCFSFSDISCTKSEEGEGKTPKRGGQF